MEYKEPVSEAWSGGWRGALIGLGIGVSVALIDPKAETGRLTGALTGVGFIGGAAYGVWYALSNNSKIERRESQLLEKYGVVTPELIHADDRYFAGLEIRKSF